MEHAPESVVRAPGLLHVRACTVRSAGSTYRAQEGAAGLLAEFEVVLLDMNGTFMFGHDRFGDGEDYGAYFKEIGGMLPGEDARRIIRDVFEYLEPRYPDPEYGECFPSIERALGAVVPEGVVSDADRQRLVATFAYHECGIVPLEHGEALAELASRFRLGLVADAWAPRETWIDALVRAGVDGLFGAMSFSSDHGVVKPSPKPFLQVLGQLGGEPGRTVVIGDSVRRDLGGAMAAGMPCILVGGDTDARALAAVDGLADVL